jgi:peptidoglycan/LPS O-acetylase OafA/YrhL
MHLKRNNLLDGWRGLAIISVLIGHFMPLPVINAGRFGVELFFVLSGRLMGELLFVKKEAIREFYWRRVTRILPILFSYILLIVTLKFIYPSVVDATANSVIASISFFYNYLHGVGYSATVFDHLWSLCIEEHTYLLLGLIAISARYIDLSPWKICLALATFCIAHGVYLTLVEGLGYYDVYWRTDTRATGILLGCGLYTLYKDKPKIFQHITPSTTVLMGILGGALSLYPVPDTIKYSAGTLSLALAITTLDRVSEYPKFILNNRIIGLFGRASFSLYIFQQLFYFNNGKYNISALCMAVIAGFMFYFFIETPARRFLNKIYTPDFADNRKIA